MQRSDILARRVDAFSFKYMGLPYIGGALGEDFGYDSDPLYRFDGFDCTTYIETVSALAMSRNHEEFEKVLLRFRYKDGFVDFRTRNHFTSLDWIPNNQAQGLIQDITKQIYPQNYSLAHTVIDKKVWFLKNHKIEDTSLAQISVIPYLPISAAVQNPELLSQIPHGSIINIVRTNWGLKEKIGTDLDVSHQGFVIHKEDGIYFRHASSEKKMVLEEPLLEYLQRMTAIKSIAGINVLQLL